MSNFQNPFRLDIILKSTYGSVFQLIVAVIVFLQHRPPVSNDFWISASIMIIIITQVVRCLYFWPIRKSKEKLLKSYPMFVFFSYATSLGWGLSALTALSTIGTTGVGLSTLVSCSTIACASTFALAPVLKVQRIYTVLILLPAVVGLAWYSFPDSDWVTVSMLSTVVFYCFYLGNRQHQTIRLIYEQQDRIKVDLLAAREIQQSLLPSPKQVIGDFQLEVLYEPCDDLSGDFFEIQSLPNHVFFYVADVTSHGTAAAQVTFLLKGIFKNILASAGEEIELTEVTRQLAIDYSSYGLNYSVGLFIGNLDTRTGQLEFISSNFPAPILLKDQKTSIVTISLNPVIDAMNPPTAYNFKKDVAQLAKGDSIYIFTDGAYELEVAPGAPEMNYRQLSKVFISNAHSEWQEPVLAALKELNQNEEFRDDLTIMKIGYQAIEKTDGATI